jgi:hypothetical protein
MLYWAPFSCGSGGSVSMEVAINDRDDIYLVDIKIPSGSALAANMRAAQACIVTNLAAGVGGCVWVLWVIDVIKETAVNTHFLFFQDYRKSNFRKGSVVGFCTGAVASLVAITPGSGYVGARESWFQLYYVQQLL